MKNSNIIILTVVIISSVFALLLVCIYLLQNKFLYFPDTPSGSRDVKNASIQSNRPFKDVWIDVDSNTTIHCAWLPFTDASGSQNVAVRNVIMFHGNAGNINQRIPIAHKLQDCLRANILLVSYRGYGLSKGTSSPSQKGIEKDSQAAFEWLCKESSLPIVIYGQSLGGAVSISLLNWALTNYTEKSGNKNLWKRIGGLIVENTFLSLRKVASSVIPLASAITFLLVDRWDNEAAFDKLVYVCENNSEIKVHFPMLFLSGKRDEIVPPSHMKNLYSIVRNLGEHTRLVLFPNGTHNYTCSFPEYYKEIKKAFP